MIELLIGGGLVLGTQAVGTVLRRSKRPKRYRPPAPICGCAHNYALHDETGCHVVSRVLIECGEPVLVDFKDEFEKTQKVVGHAFEKYEKVGCPCKRYTGPEPIPQMYAP